MEMRIRAMLAVLFCAAGLGLAREVSSDTKAAVGAIRWDAWWSGNDFERFLGPQQWRGRLPFYGREIADDRVEVRSDTQQVMDQEIAYASRAGLDYWAFCYYHPSAWPGADAYNYGLRLYLSSTRKADLNFCLILLAGSLGPKEQWPALVDYLVKLFREPTYQKLLAGRPLLYFFELGEGLDQHFGSREAAGNALRHLRERSAAAGLKPPYLVAMVFDPRVGAKQVEELGFDAISAYSLPGEGETREYPYPELAAANQRFWEQCKATGKPVIPIVNAGWDNRPRRVDAEQFQALYGSPPGGPWFTQPAPAELAEHLRAALAWNQENRNAAEANAAIIYAWNETDEGGWLVPTKGEGTARLDAISKVLGPPRCKSR
jgi:hypothetical protein